MKRLLLLNLVLITCSLLNAQVYVDATAMGANDGSSWADAYTDLGAALAATTTGEIWVAAGNYTSGADSTTTFNITGALSLYGGFSGTEMNLADRDISANTTTLNGDHNGDDIVDDFSTNRSDNARHIVTVDSLIAGTVRIDGFTISNASTTFGGGGILSFNKLDVANCTFRQNATNAGLGGVGAGLAIFGPGAGSGIVTQGSSIEGCVFEDNFSEFGISYITSTDSMQISNTIYEDNVTDLGCIYISFSVFGDFNNIEIADNSGFFGAGIRYWQTGGMVVRNSEFSGNDAWYGAAIRADMRFFENPIDEGTGLIVDSCFFDGNSVTDPGNEFGYFGGAIFLFSMRGTKVMNSEFTGNTGNDLGGAIFINNEGLAVRDTTDLIVENSVFSGNVAEAAGGSAGALFTRFASAVYRNCTIEDSESDNFSGAAYFIGSEITLRDCEFKDNSTAAGGGGAILVGFTGTTNIENCDISNNTANFGGGISVQNNFTVLNVTNSKLQGNISRTGSAGAIFGFTGSTINISKSTLSQNQASQSVGGAISMLENNTDNQDSLNLLTLNIEKSQIFLNTSTQGGAINIFNASGTMVNNVFYNNSTTLDEDGNGGGGGAISVNIFGDKPDEMTFINNTFGSNTAAGIGSNLSFFQDSTAMTTINLQNNISYDINPTTLGIDIEGETPGNLTINTLGGNLIAGDPDTDVQAVFMTNAADVVTPTALANDIFIDALLGNYDLVGGSPAVGIGIVAGAPTDDIDDKIRGGMIDAGAYERDGIDPDGTREEVINDASQLIVLPNPVQSTLYLQMDNAWTGDLSVRVMDLQGRQVRSTQIRKFGETQTFQLDLGNLPAGSYEVLVSNGSALLARQIIKQ